MGAMFVKVKGIAVTIYKIPSVKVVFIAVPVIINKR